MDLTQIVKDTTPYLNSAGLGAITGASAYLAVSGLRALGPGSTIVEELKDPRNFTVGFATALCATFAGYELAQHLPGVNPEVLKYTGAAAIGGLSGAISWPVASAFASKESISANVSVKTRNGFLFGASLLPVAYLAADLLSKYL